MVIKPNVTFGNKTGRVFCVYISTCNVIYKLILYDTACNLTSMGRVYKLINSSKLCQIGILLTVCFIIYSIYTFLPSRSFTSNTLLYHEMDKKNRQVDVDQIKQHTDLVDTIKHHDDVDPSDIADKREVVNISITFTKAKQNWSLQEKFKVTISSMFKWTSVPLNLYIIGDRDSQDIAKEVINNAAKKFSVHCRVSFFQKPGRWP